MLTLGLDAHQPKFFLEAALPVTKADSGIVKNDPTSCPPYGNPQFSGDWASKGGDVSKL